MIYSLSPKSIFWCKIQLHIVRNSTPGYPPGESDHPFTVRAVSVQICLLRTEKPLVSKQSCLPLKWLSKKATSATRTFLLKKRGRHSLSHSMFMLGVCMHSYLTDTVHKTKHSQDSEKGRKYFLAHSKIKPNFFCVNTNLQSLFTWYICHRTATYCSCLQKNRETESNGTKWDHTEKKFILQKTEDPGRLDVKTAQGFKKWEIQ